MSISKLTDHFFYVNIIFFDIIFCFICKLLHGTLLNYTFFKSRICRRQYLKQILLRFKVVNTIHQQIIRNSVRPLIHSFYMINQLQIFRYVFGKSLRVVIPRCKAYCKHLRTILASPIEFRRSHYPL